MEETKSNQLELKVNGIFLILISIFIGVNIGVINVANIFAAFVIGLVSGVIIGTIILVTVLFGFLILYSISNMEKGVLVKPPIYYANRLTHFFYSSKNRREIFEPIIADWQEEYFEALFKKEIWKARWITARYIYALLDTMWQKSPIGDLIRFVIKIAKP